MTVIQSVDARALNFRFFPAVDVRCGAVVVVVSDSQQEGRPIVTLTIVLVAMTARTTGGASTRNVKKPDKTCPLRARCESSIHPTPFPEHQCVVAGRRLKLK